MRLDQGWKGYWVISTLKVTLNGFNSRQGRIYAPFLVDNSKEHQSHSESFR